VQRYAPYGETRGSETVDVPYQYTGQRNEAAIGLYYYGARWYDPALGRFIQADPIVPAATDPQSLNRYSQVYERLLRHVAGSTSL
jgi:RHS repeat-associated protein